ncbi:asparaginase [Ramlibacter sp. PS4R-6]|uniref:asparaginase n=1 Tax=Ramlibacter sp. PS4R-6 TaxID=3133438 RepID=UPI0030953F8F
MAQRKIVVLGTGGTLAGTSSRPGDNVGYTAAQVGIADLVGAIPLLRGVPIETEQVAQVDSKDMTRGVWDKLEDRCKHHLGREEVAGIVITHGTDTIEETAFYLQEVLSPQKPVVLTCAMRPATSLSPDGPQNIVDAVAVATQEEACGVVVVCAGVIHDSRDVMKVHHYRLDPFSSGDAGPIGYVEEGEVRLVRNWPGDWILYTRTAPVPLQRVEIVFSHAGASRDHVDALVRSGVQGIVVATTGNGTVHRELMPALLDAQKQGVKVLRASRCAEGGVIAQPGDELPSTNLSPVKARILLLLGG